MSYCEEGVRHKFGKGDRVRLVQNHYVCGQVIGEEDWHSKYLVRLVGVLEPVMYENVELEPDPDFSPAKAEDDAFADNVIDFAAASRAKGRREHGQV